MAVLSADEQNALTIQEAYAGDCAVIVRIRDRDLAPTGTLVQLELNHGTLLAQTVGAHDLITFPVFGALQQGDNLRLYAAHQPLPPDVIVQPRRSGAAIPGTRCEPLETASIPVRTYQPRLFVGGLLNQFYPGEHLPPSPSVPDPAADNVPQSTTETRTQKKVLVRFLVRASLSNRLLMEGEATLAGRSACRATECLQPDNLVDTLHTATSFEAFLAPAFRATIFQARSESPLHMYVFTRIGAIGVVDRTNFRYIYEWGLDFRVADGVYQGSYTRMSWGKNELLSHAWGRFRHDTLLTWSMRWGWARVLAAFTGAKPFLRIRTDSDFGDSPDALQLFYGVTMDLNRLAGW